LTVKILDGKEQANGTNYPVLFNHTNAVLYCDKNTNEKTTKGMKAPLKLSCKVFVGVDNPSITIYHLSPSF